MKLNSLKFKIPFFVMVFAFACVLITGIIIQHTFINRLEINIEEKNMMISDMASNELELYLHNSIETVITAANFSTQSNNDLNAIKREIFRMYDNFSYFDLIFFMNKEAQMVFSKPSNENVQNRRYKDRDYYWEVIGDQKPYSISALLVSSVLKELHFIIAAPVSDSNDDLIGLIGAGIPLSNIKEILQDFEVGFDGRIWIADETGSIVIHTGQTIDNEIVKVNELDIVIQNDDKSIMDILSEKENKNIRYQISNQEYYGAVTFVDEAEWMVVVEQSSDAISHEIKEAMSNLVLIQILVLMMAVIIGLIVANWLIQPIHKLLRQVRLLPDFLENNKELVVEDLKNQGDEISELSDAFNVMTLQLRDNITNLENSYKRENRIQQYLNNILTSVHSGIIVANSNNEITIINDQAKNITRLNKLNEAPKDLYNLLILLELDIADEIDDVINGEVSYSDFETTLKPIDKDEIIISYSCSPVKNKNNEFLGIVLQFRNITRLKEIEIELRKEDRINTLGELSASIIHDIGNPLAGMSNLIEIVKDASISDASRMKALDLLSEEVNDLNILVIDFLDFVKSSEIEQSPTNLKKILDDCISLFDREISAKLIDLNIDTPKKEAIVIIKGRSVKQAIINIYKNAIEAVEIGGRIDVKIVENANYYELIIKDNGKGMDESIKLKLFDPFFTTKESGTGLGLSIANSALKENDAKLMVDSNEGVGSKFVIRFKKVTDEYFNS